MPFITVKKENQESFQSIISKFIQASEKISGNTETQVKKALFNRPKDKKGDLSFLDRSFWQNTESSFYLLLNSIKRCLDLNGVAANLDNEKKEWHKVLCNQAEKLFDQFLISADIGDLNPKKIALARNELLKSNNGKYIKQKILEIPPEPKQKKPPKSRKPKGAPAK
jgi:CRISPR system Cascade subunit CasA